MAGKFEIKSSASGQVMFNLKASNGQIILTSQSYKDKAGAKGGIESVKKNAADDASYERKTSSDNKAYFVLNAANKQVIGRSEMYGSAAAMENGIASVKANAPGAEVVDATVPEEGKRSKGK
ncbi:MAG: YegP family protein [Deltaproteobacteria bacterium]|nr:YegP family protein [Deltaproteobacteria bacterium]